MQYSNSLAKLRKRGYRLTSQRCIILEEIVNTKSHPNADEIFQKAKKRISNISFGTVYRNLKVLKELGLIMELNYGKSYSRYDGNPANHQHFVCLNCGKVYDIDEQVHVEIDRVKISKMDAVVKDFRLEFYGYCPQCK